MLLTGTLESELGLPEATLCYLFPAGTHTSECPHDPAGALSAACTSMGMGLGSPVEAAGFHIKLEHLLLFQQGWARRGIPSGCSEKGVPCFCSHDLWGVCIQVSEWVSDYNSYNLLELGIKGCLEMGSSLQNINTLLVILILSIQFTDGNLITC